jgi:hypothetical protein
LFLYNLCTAYKYSCVRHVHTYHTLLFRQHNGDDAPWGDGWLRTAGNWGLAFVLSDYHTYQKCPATVLSINVWQFFILLGLPVLIVIVWAIVKSFAPVATESQVSTCSLKKKKEILFWQNSTEVSMLQEKCLLVLCKPYKILWLFIRKKGFYLYFM